MTDKKTVMPYFFCQIIVIFATIKPFDLCEKSFSLCFGSSV